jgi:hypothetical protein
MKVLLNAIKKNQLFGMSIFYVECPVATQQKFKKQLGL